jgi:hypothetical protein
MAGWYLLLRRKEHPFYRCFEGQILAPGETEAIECFLMLGRDHFTVELKCLSAGIPEAVLAAWISHLGSPAAGPITSARTGEIEEPAGEIILSATWRFSPAERPAFEASIEEFLETHSRT